MTISLDEDQLVDWGRRIGECAETPLVLELSGDLGAGKTTLARAIARGAGVMGHIPSPTYNLLFRYPASREREIVHIDLYRLEDPDEVWALGWSELPPETGIVLIEWGARAEALLLSPRWKVTLAEDDEEDGRRLIGLEAIGSPPPLPELQPAPKPDLVG